MEDPWRARTRRGGGGDGALSTPKEVGPWLTILRPPYAIRQFEIEPWIPLRPFGVDVSFTNSASAMVVTTVAVAGFMIVATRRPQVVPGRLQAAAKWVYGFVADTVVSAAGEAGRPHIPFLFTLFAFIFFGTLIGMTPVRFTFTSHIIEPLLAQLLDAALDQVVVGGGRAEAIVVVRLAALVQRGGRRWRACHVGRFYLSSTLVYGGWLSTAHTF